MANELVKRDPAMLEIFTEEQTHCHSLAKLNTAVGRCFDLMKADIYKNSLSPVKENAPAVLEMLDRVLKGAGSSGKEALVADMDALPEGVKEKLKKGIYKLAESKQVDGNFRAAIVNEKNEEIVKQVTLKQAKLGEQPVADMNTMAVQAALKNITEQLTCIESGMQYLITLNRRANMQTPFFDAMQKILDARDAANENQMANDVEKAIDLLEHGLNGLYGDLSDNISQLNKGAKLPVFTDHVMGYIGEDMVYIPQYVALLSYMLNYSGRNNRAKEVVKQYRTELEKFTEDVLPGSDLTAAQLIHANYKYTEKNLDFWLDGIENVKNRMEYLPEYSEKKTIYVITGEEN